MNRALLVASAAALDLLCGDPPSLPHPVSAIAAAAKALERPARALEAETTAGAGVALLVIAGAGLAGAAAERMPPAVRAVSAAASLAAGSLIDHVERVRGALERGDLERARIAVACIVGRDTAALDESGVARAAIESLGESLCDGVIAPVLALALFGLPGAYAYKAINTLDSLFGHIEAPYTRFGRASARIDDFANLLPARVTALAIAAAAWVNGADARRALRIVARDARKHRSPNAGFGEAAMAGALAVQLGGPSAYDGIVHDAPLLGSGLRAARASDVRDALRIAFTASVLAYALATALAAVRR